MLNRSIEIVEVSPWSGIAAGCDIDRDSPAPVRRAGLFPPRTGDITKDHQ